MIAHDSLPLKSEDFLYDLIESRFAKDEAYFHLLEQVRFELLPAETLLKFSQLAARLFDRMTVPIWEQVSQRLVRSAPTALSLENPRLKQFGISHPFSQSQALNGIVAFLTKDCGGNVHDQNVVKIMALNQTRRPCRLRTSATSRRDT